MAFLGDTRTTANSDSRQHMGCQVSICKDIKYLTEDYEYVLSGIYLNLL